MTGVLRAHTSITVRIVETDAAPVNPAVAPVRVTPEFADQLSRRFLNAASAEDRYDYIEEHGKYVVVTDAMYDDVLAPLVQWKIEKGIPTEVVYAADFGMDFDAIPRLPRRPVPQRGHDPRDPRGRRGPGSGQPGHQWWGNGYCDPCYAYVEGNDHYPEFFVGRLIVHTVAEMQVVVDRTLEYEKTPFLEEEWFNIAVGIGSNEGAGIGDNGESDWQHLNVIKDASSTTDSARCGSCTREARRGNSPTGGPTADEAGNPVANDMVELVNKGMSFINYTGHGYHGGIASSGFDINAIGQTNNNGMYGFFAAVACCVGDFDEGEGPATALVKSGSSTRNNGQPAGGIGGAFSSVLAELGTANARAGRDDRPPLWRTVRWRSATPSVPSSPTVAPA